MKLPRTKIHEAISCLRKEGSLEFTLLLCPSLPSSKDAKPYGCYPRGPSPCIVELLYNVYNKLLPKSPSKLVFHHQSWPSSKCLNLKALAHLWLPRCEGTVDNQVSKWVMAGKQWPREPGQQASNGRQAMDRRTMPRCEGKTVTMLQQQHSMSVKTHC